MTVFRDPAEMAKSFGRVVFCAGFFDGVHVGHRALVAAAVAEAEKSGATPAALTLEPHPAAVLAPGAAPALLVPRTERRLRLLEDAGLEACLLLEFTKETAATPPRDFVLGTFGPWIENPGFGCTVVCGGNWRFGAGGAGTPGDLSAIAGGRIGVRVVPLATVGGEAVSSSRIRAAVGAGDFPLAAALLGRPWEIEVSTFGTGAGRGVGTSLGAPTANAAVADAPRPPTGVYAVDAAVLDGEGDGAFRRAVANYGFRPTFPDARPGEPVLEMHFLSGVSGDLHGRRMAVRFLARLRDERVFDTPGALAAQIRADCAAAAGLPPQGPGGHQEAARRKA
ncbi:MAG: bifunctional riboflavin kinase/FAD synthetase [Kiritimatiellae bacterium]|nr:bifunctional riboflavin kinase/FAD synthetase [Kiritimatiellia bacterium]